MAQNYPVLSQNLQKPSLGLVARLAGRGIKGNGADFTRLIESSI
jgi:hypothetical protein